jgi:hypothetical protein
VKTRVPRARLCARRAAPLVLACTLSCLTVSQASAQTRAGAAGVEERDEVFRYVEPADAYPLRAALEVVGLLGLGTAQYFSNQEGNSADWDFEYSWDDFRSKISGSGYSFDTNNFDTNFITHPGGGTLYYWAARGNRLSIPASFAYAATASTLWELLGEFREHASINDMFVTPISGLVLGESTLQLGAFFDRSCASATSSVLGTLLAPAKAVHDAIDGAVPLRDRSCDRFGFTRRGAHAFRIGLEQGAVWATEGSRAVSAETSIDVTSRVIALARYGRPGRALESFSNGNASELWLHSGLTRGGFSDFTLGANVVPFGLHFRDLGRDGHGDEVLFGLLLATEYSVHRFDAATPRSSIDRFFTLDAPGIALAYRRLQHGTRFEAELHSSLTLAGVEAFAIAEYLRRGSIDDLTSVADASGYNHALGLTLSPRLRLIARDLEAGVELKATHLWGITLLDRERDSEVEIAEARRRASVWVSVGPLFWNVRLSLRGQLLQRWGSLGDARAERVELRASTGVDAVF